MKEVDQRHPNKLATNRREFLGYAGALGAELLFARRIASGQGDHRGPAAAPGALDLVLSALSTSTLRISISPANDPPRITELGVVQHAGQTLAGPGLLHPATINWGRYTVKIADAPLQIGVYQDGRLRQEISFDLDSTDVRFNLDGPVFGLGEGVHPYDRRGTRDDMANGQHSPDLETYGARLPIPWVMSPRGWGVFIGQPSGSMSFSQTEARFRGSEATSTRNVYLVLGDTPVDVLTAYADLTGHPHLPPLWAFGYQQSHRTVKDTDEILGVVKTFREKKLPCDAVIYLGTGFCPSGWNTDHGSFTFNETVFPNPAEVIGKIHDEHFKIVLHVVPPGDFHGEVTDTGSAAEASGDAARYWPKHTALAKLGVDGWWPDEGDRLNVYARLQRNEMYFAGSRRDDPSRRPFALHRNGYAGLQRYGWLWSGDTFSTWKALQAQIMEGINIGLSGIPYWGTDTGGFVPTPEFSPELFVRWFQFSAFCPSFRSHGRSWHLHLPWGWNLGTPGPKEVEGDWVNAWPPEADLHRADVEQICRKYLNLRYQLLPYIYSTAAQAHHTGIPMIRALWLEYPHDEKAALVDDSYLWGDHFLIAPVYQEKASEREVYLPQGSWWNFWTSQRLEGGVTKTVSVALDTIPIFAKAGAIVPMDPIRQYTSEATNSPTTLQIFPGADGQFHWYDDDHSSFKYEQGDFMSVLCEWNDGQHTLTLTRDPKGKMGAGREVNVAVFGTTDSKTVTLKASPVQVKL